MVGLEVGLGWRVYVSDLFGARFEGGVVVSAVDCGDGFVV